jgi:hypothetical protein
MKAVFITFINFYNKLSESIRIIIKNLELGLVKIILDIDSL